MSPHGRPKGEFPHGGTARSAKGAPQSAHDTPSDSLPRRIGNIAMAANVSQLISLFDVEVEVMIDTPEFRKQSLAGRDEIRNAALAARQSFFPLEVKFLDLNVAIAPEGTNATVQLTAEIHQSRKRDLFMQELKFVLRKVNGKWLIVRVETVRTLT